jgi:hypothetical protein
MNRRHTISRICALALLFGIPFGGAPVHAQPHADSSFAVVLYGGVGLTRYVSAINTPVGIRASLHPGGAAYSFRAMWYPDHLLRIGIETGWVRFYSYTLHGAADGNLYTSAAPLLLVFSMPLTDRLNAYVGGGGYFVSSKLDFEGVVRETEFSQGYMLGASYHFPLNASWGLAAELKWYNASQFEDGTFCAQVVVAWRCLSW